MIVDTSEPLSIPGNQHTVLVTGLACLHRFVNSSSRDTQ